MTSSVSGDALTLEKGFRPIISKASTLATTLTLTLGVKRAQGSFSPNDSITVIVTNVTLMGKIGGGGMPVTVKGQFYGDGDGVVRCEQTFNVTD